MKESTDGSNNRFEIVVIGTSLGGLEALRTLLAGLPSSFCVPVVIVQHRGKESEDTLTPLLQRRCPLVIEEAEDKQTIVPGYVYLAPRDYHLLVEPGRFALSSDAAVNQARPSIDVLFESAADAYGSAVIGVILTGANADGARGAARIKQRGGLVVVQDPATAEARAMPDAALAATTVDRTAGRRAGGWAAPRSTRAGRGGQQRQARLRRSDRDDGRPVVG